MFLKLDGVETDEYGVCGPELSELTDGDGTRADVGVATGAGDAAVGIVGEVDGIAGGPAVVSPALV